MDELLQVRGITRELLYGRPDTPGLAEHLTVFGPNVTNMNTASPVVLRALGFAPAEIDFIVGRRPWATGGDPATVPARETADAQRDLPDRGMGGRLDALGPRRHRGRRASDRDRAGAGSGGAPRLALVGGLQTRGGNAGRSSGQGWREQETVNDVVGLALRDGQVDVVALRGSLGTRRLIAAFSVPADEDSAGAIRRQLMEAGVRARRVHVGLPRRAVVAKAVELPAVPGADLRRMVGFELERHLPFPPSDALFDFEVLDSGAGRPVRVLLVAVERRSHERVRQLLRDAGLTPRLLGVAIHSLARLAAGDPARGRIVLWLDAADAELAVVVRGRVVASRAFPLPPDPHARGRALEAEVARTLATLPEAERGEVAEVVVGGIPPPAFEVETLPVRIGIDAPSSVSASEDVSLPALAAALERPTRKLPVANLLPEELRPRPFPWPMAATAALALFTLGIGAAIPAVAFVKERRALAALEASIARLAPEVQRAERLTADVERARRELVTLRSFEEQGLHPLPMLRELTDTLPADAWLTTLSVDRTGIELGGFANAASQLIPLLEASPGLERVEFTSPVTKGRDREQFRLRAAWERGGGR